MHRLQTGATLFKDLMFKKVLIANRGEIAVRVAQTLREMGIIVVAVYSQPDRAAVHVACADEAYPLEGETAAETYLRGDKIIAIAKSHGVDAIHPGYGFLSENPEFAEACVKAGITFIGPNADVMRAMGNKIVAKKTLEKAGVPVVPGWSGEGGFDAKGIAKEANKIGYPVLVKAASGGGGKGMRVVTSEKGLAGSLEAARREAKSAFGDATVFLEKFLERPRHIEFQIFGDSHGNVVHMFERECSIQRRHQKIVEETPSPALSDDLRKRMGEAAVAAAKAVNYTNAGTVEFLLDESGKFYFLEINTRLQVEHPVTEMTLRYDLVRAQVLVALGESLPFTQDELTPDGHAVEVRIYAEDSASGFLPSTGTIACYVPPAGVNIRVDSGVKQGSEVTVFYDPMLAKLICFGRTRDESLERLAFALDNFVVLGVTTNIEFLRNLIDHPDFLAGDMHTGFLEEHSIAATRAGRDEAPPMPDEVLIAAAVALRENGRSVSRAGQHGHAATLTDAPWRSADAWRGA
jgi:3-methylcrotonyl-CoA carboxylase alpha subunit